MVKVRGRKWSNRCPKKKAGQLSSLVTPNTTIAWVLACYQAHHAVPEIFWAIFGCLTIFQFWILDFIIRLCKKKSSRLELLIRTAVVFERPIRRLVVDGMTVDLKPIVNFWWSGLKLFQIEKLRKRATAKSKKKKNFKGHMIISNIPVHASHMTPGFDVSTARVIGDTLIEQKK